MNTTLTSLSIAEAAVLIQSRELSPVELTEAHLEAIAARDDELRAFITVTAALAREQAEKAEREITAGNYRGPIHGIPIAVKDNIESAGTRTTAGSIFLDEFVPNANAAALQRLEDAGAVMLGKTNMHEWAISVTTNNPFYGRCLNPLDTRVIPGGSSGGSAAALAAAMCMGALGTDTGGSVRLPAALCGVVGFKPTYGRTSQRGVIPLSFSLDHIGPMARTVYDTALLYDTIAGYDPSDPFSLDAPVGDGLERVRRAAEEGLSGLKIALAIEDFDRDRKAPDAEIVRLTRDAARRLEALGAAVTEVILPGMGEVGRANSAMLVTETAAYHAERYAQQPEKFSDYMRAAIERGQGISGTRYAEARRFQAEVTRQLELFFESYDLLVTPACPVPAPVHDEPQNVQDARMWLVAYTAPFNFTGCPAISVPCGSTADGLAAGVQIVGRRGNDWDVLTAANAWARNR